MTWNSELSIGIASIDTQHKKLVALINELFDGMQAGRGRDVLGRVLKGLVDYTHAHFKYEEDIFARVGYADRANHKLQHEALIRRVTEIRQKYDESGGGVLSIEVLNFLKTWLTSHIQQTDRKYAPHLISKGVN